MSNISKTCRDCLQVLPIESFYIKTSSKPPTRLSDWTSRCKLCERDKKLLEYHKNPNKAKEYKKRWYLANKERISRESKAKRAGSYDRWLERRAAYRLKKAKNQEKILAYRAVLDLPPDKKYIYNQWKKWQVSAKKRKLEWNLDYETVWSMWENGTKKCQYTGRALVLAHNNRDTISLDRIDSTAGYTKDNVCFCTVIANKMKLDLTLDEFRTIAAQITATFANYSPK